MAHTNNIFIVVVYSYVIDLEWLIDFNGISIRQGLFYIKELGNRIQNKIIA